MKTLLGQLARSVLLLVLVAVAVALVLSLPLIAVVVAGALVGMLTSEPGALQLGATVACAMTLRPVCIVRAYPIELADDGLLFHLLVNCEVAP